MSSSAVLGQFLWHELLTADPAAGAGFYSKVFGWSAQPWEGSEEYTMLSRASGPVGGARVVGKDPLANKAGPSWLTYVGVPDVAAALAAVQARGGQVLHPVTAVGADGGSYAVIADPHGATIGLYQPGAGMSGGTDPKAAPVAWHELTAADPQAALQFYKDIFGWEVLATHEMGGDVGTYYLFGLGKTQMGGAFVWGKDQSSTRPRWLVYFDVPSVTAAVAATKSASGQVLNGPHQVPGGNWVAQMVDSHGVMLAVHGPKEAAAAAPKAATKKKAKSKAAAKTKTKTKTKAKATAKSKAKTKSAPKAKTKATGRKAKKAPARKVKTKAKTKAKAKPKAKSKAKAKGKARAKARKAPRRGK